MTKVSYYCNRKEGIITSALVNLKKDNHYCYSSTPMSFYTKMKVVMIQL